MLDKLNSSSVKLIDKRNNKHIYFKFADNPLVCDCELQWYKNWRKNLRDKDDDLMQKKRTVCMMNHEHREYSLTNLPLEKMHCTIKSYDGAMSSQSELLFLAPTALSLWFITVSCTLVDVIF